MRAAPTAKVYLEGLKRPIYLGGEADFDLATAILTGRDTAEALTGTTTDGESIVIPGHKITSVVRPTPEPSVVADPGILWGRQVRIRNAKAVAMEDTDDNMGNTDGAIVRDMVPEGERERYVCIQAEDMAEALVLIIGTGFTDPIWINPAVPEGAVARYVEVARLVCEAEVLVNDANTPEDVEEFNRRANRPHRASLDLTIRVGDRVLVCEPHEGARIDQEGTVDDIVNGEPLVKLDDGPALVIPGSKLSAA